MSSSRTPVLRVVGGGVLAALAVTVVLAPLFTTGWCADAAEGGTSVCGSYASSLVGIQTSAWVWLGVLAVVVVVTVVAAVAVHRRQRAQS